MAMTGPMKPRALLFAFAFVIGLGPSASAAPSLRISVARCEAQFVTIPATEIVETYRMRVGLIRPYRVQTQYQYLESLNKVAEAVRSLRADPKLTDTVVYPLSGYDLTAPMVLFPNANTYILIDRNSVVDARDLPKLVHTKLELLGGDRNKEWVYWRETGTDVFRNIVASIFAVSPSSKLKRIDFLLDSEGAVSLGSVRKSVSSELSRPDQRKDMSYEFPNGNHQS